MNIKVPEHKASLPYAFVYHKWTFPLGLATVLSTRETGEEMTRTLQSKNNRLQDLRRSNI
jgi:hypothetical protein